MEGERGGWKEGRMKEGGKEGGREGGREGRREGGREGERRMEGGKDEGGRERGKEGGRDLIDFTESSLAHQMEEKIAFVESWVFIEPSRNKTHI